MHNILVTGAAGSIGHHLIKRLSQRDCKVIIIDNLSNADSNFLNRVKAALLTSHMSRSNFVRLNGIGNVSIYIEDIRNKESIIDIFKKEDIDTWNSFINTPVTIWRHIKCLNSLPYTP